MALLKPGFAVKDQRSDTERRTALMSSTIASVLFIQEQLTANGATLEQVLAWAAQHAVGVSVVVTPPEDYSVPLPTGLQGPKGDAGPTGPVGPEGPKGDAGPAYVPPAA